MTKAEKCSGLVTSKSVALMLDLLQTNHLKPNFITQDHNWFRRSLWKEFSKKEQPQLQSRHNKLPQNLIQNRKPNNGKSISLQELRCKNWFLLANWRFSQRKWILGTWLRKKHSKWWSRCFNRSPGHPNNLRLNPTKIICFSGLSRDLDPMIGSNITQYAQCQSYKQTK